MCVAQARMHRHVWANGNGMNANTFILHRLSSKRTAICMAYRYTVAALQYIIETVVISIMRKSRQEEEEEEEEESYDSPGCGSISESEDETTTANEKDLDINDDIMDFFQDVPQISEEDIAAGLRNADNILAPNDNAMDTFLDVPYGTTDKNKAAESPCMASGTAKDMEVVTRKDSHTKQRGRVHWKEDDNAGVVTQHSTKKGETRRPHESTDEDEDEDSTDEHDGFRHIKKKIPAEEETQMAQANKKKRERHSSTHKKPQQKQKHRGVLRTEHSLPKKAPLSPLKNRHDLSDHGENSDESLVVSALHKLKKSAQASDDEINTADMIATKTPASTTGVVYIYTFLKFVNYICLKCTCVHIIQRNEEAPKERPTVKETVGAIQRKFSAIWNLN